MSPLFRKLSPLERRQKQVELELASVRSRIRTVSRRLRKGGDEPPEARTGFDADERWKPPAGFNEETFEIEPVEPSFAYPEPDSGGASRKARQGDTRRNDGGKKRPLAPKEDRSEAVRDTRFVEYLSGSLQSASSLRHERQTQRNKAIVMVVLVVAVLLWVLFQFVIP